MDYGAAYTAAVAMHDPHWIIGIIAGTCVTRTGTSVPNPVSGHAFNICMSAVTRMITVPILVCAFTPLCWAIAMAFEAAFDGASSTPADTPGTAGKEGILARAEPVAVTLSEVRVTPPSGDPKCDWSDGKYEHWVKHADELTSLLGEKPGLDEYDNIAQNVWRKGTLYYDPSHDSYVSVVKTTNVDGKTRYIHVAVHKGTNKIHSMYHSHSKPHSRFQPTSDEKPC